jgi:hypothetical protein
LPIESNSDGNLKKIRKLGLLLSDKVLMASSSQRLAIHVSAGICQQLYQLHESYSR